MIFLAVAGPTPLMASSSFSEALLRSTSAAAAFCGSALAATAAGAPTEAMNAAPIKKTVHIKKNCLAEKTPFPFNMTSLLFRFSLVH